MKVRLAASGPVIANIDGGPFEPGTGAMLRLAEGMTTIGGSLAISTEPETIGTELGGGTVLVPSLLLPNPDLNYRATLLLDASQNGTLSPASVVLYIDTSVDGATWEEQVSNVHYIGPAAGIDGNLANPRQIRLDMTLRKGSDLEGGMLATAPSIRVRGRIKVVTDVPTSLVDSRQIQGEDGPFVGTALLQLSEHF